MATAELLRKTVADFFEVDEGQIGSAFSLQGRGQGSIARAALDAAIRRRVGVTSPSVYSARTYGELEARIAPGSVPSIATLAPAVDGPAPVALPSGPSAPASCGVDIELVANLPHTADHWEDPFYLANFSHAEIAYCLLQESPPEHFAARWCAKEAVKKCDASLANEEPRNLEVVRASSGAPYLVHLTNGSPPRRLPHALSLSHTPHSAVAVVVRVDAMPPVVAPTPTLAPVLVAPAPETPRRRGGLPLLISLVALALAVFALLRTFPGLK